MAFLKQRVGRWSLRGASVKARQVNGTEILSQKRIELKLYGNEVYYTACSLLVISKNFCSKLHRQKGFIESSFYVPSGFTSLSVIARG